MQVGNKINQLKFKKLEKQENMHQKEVRAKSVPQPMFGLVKGVELLEKEVLRIK